MTSTIKIKKTFKQKLKRRLLISFGILLVLILVTIAFISPITKYLIEKYDEKYTGRKITLDWAYVNPFTGYTYFSNLKIYESKSDSIFFAAESVSANVSVRKLFFGTYEISELTLNNPVGKVIQNEQQFNFDDVITRFSSKKNSKKPASPAHVSILNITINNGTFYYLEKQMPIYYFIKKVNIKSSGTRWDADTVAATFSFLAGPETGKMHGDFTMNIENGDYRFHLIARKYGLKIMEQYLKDMSNYGSLSANLDANVRSKGNVNTEGDISSSGMLTINDFHVGKTPTDDYASFDKMVFVVRQLSPLHHKYLFDSVSLIHPYFKYEEYDHLNNLQTMFGKDGKNITAANNNRQKFNLVIEIANYMKTMSKNFFKSNYEIGRVAIYKGNLRYTNFSLSEKFTADLTPIYIKADSINKNRKRVKMVLTSGIKPFGNVHILLSINPNDSSDFDIRYNIKRLPAAMFNPYTITHTSFPLDRGTIALNGIWNVQNGLIKSYNHVLLIDPRIAGRVRNGDTKWIPMPLIMALTRERGNAIDYEIPITGNLHNPSFNWRDPIFDLVENIFVKPPTTPYRMEVRSVETQIEKSLALTWAMRQYSMHKNQKKFVKAMAGFLSNNPRASMIIYPQQYTIKEKEYILYFEAKKKYFMLVNKKSALSFNRGDSISVEKMSVKDSLFVKYLDRKVNHTLVFTMEEKCARFVKPELVNAKLNWLRKQREAAFMYYFNEKQVAKQIKIASTKNVIPYNGFSFYKVVYKDEFPESLIEAWKKMEELNQQSPRKKFRRKKNKNVSQS